MEIIGRFADLTKNKVKILQELYGSDEIVKCLVCNDDNFLDYDISGLDRTSLVYNHLWPFQFIPEIKTVAKTFITMKSKHRSDGETYRRNLLYFYAITHKSIISTDYGLRHDYLIDKIDEIFHKSKEFNSSRLTFTDMDEYHADSAGNWIVASIGYTSLKI